MLPKDGIKLSSDEAVTWLPNSVPLDKKAKAFYNAGSRISAYQSITKDVYELLLVEEEEMDDSRFTQLEGDFLTDAKFFAQVMRDGPFEETSEGSGEWKEVRERCEKDFGWKEEDTAKARRQMLDDRQANNGGKSG